MKIFGFEIKRITEEEKEQEETLNKAKTIANYSVEDSLKFIKNRRIERG